MSNLEYRSNEWQSALRALTAVEKQTLAERREARAEWGEALLDPVLIGERVSWLINGSYGYGQCLMAKRAAMERGNRVAKIGQLLSAFEWRCPAAFARQAFVALTPAQQQAVNKSIAYELENAEWAISDADSVAV